MVFSKQYRHRNVSLTVWNNKTKEGDNDFTTYTLQKSYKNDKGEYINNNTFTTEELLVALQLASKAVQDSMLLREATTDKEAVEAPKAVQSKLR